MFKDNTVLRGLKVRMYTLLYYILCIYCAMLRVTRTFYLMQYVHNVLLYLYVVYVTGSAKQDPADQHLRPA